MLDALIPFEDSNEVSDELLRTGGRYWEAEASTHIAGLWRVALELAKEIKRLRKVVDKSKNIT